MRITLVLDVKPETMTISTPEELAKLLPGEGTWVEFAGADTIEGTLVQLEMAD